MPKGSKIAFKERIFLCLIVVGCWTISLFTFINIPTSFLSSSNFISEFLALSLFFSLLGFLALYNYENHHNKKDLYFMNLFLGLGLFAGWIMIAWMENFKGC